MFRLVILILLTATAGCGLTEDPRSEMACVNWLAGAQPLLVGDTTRLSAGTLDESHSNCDPPPPQRVSWTSEQPAVASVDAEGLVRGLTPGRVTVLGVSGDDTVRSDGYVLPPGWTARVVPDSATVRVGDSVSFMVVAMDSLGGELPIVPYWLYTPEWRSRGAGDTAGQSIPPRLTAEHAFQNVTTPSVFHMETAGTTSLIGQLGDRRLSATVVVLPADTSRP
jgi:hypothetical protein